MVTTRLTVVEYAKQLVAHGAHAADIEVIEGLLAELEKSKKAIESLRELTRKQFELVRMSAPLINLQPSENMISDVVASALKLQEAANEFEAFRTQWKVDNPDLAAPNEYVNSYSSALSMNGGGLLAIPSDTPMHRARPPLEQYEDVAPRLSRSKE